MINSGAGDCGMIHKVCGRGRGVLSGLKGKTSSTGKSALNTEQRMTLKYTLNRTGKSGPQEGGRFVLPQDRTTPGGSWNAALSPPQQLTTQWQRSSTRRGAGRVVLPRGQALAARGPSSIKRRIHRLQRAGRWFKWCPEPEEEAAPSPERVDPALAASATDEPGCSG